MKEITISLGSNINPISNLQEARELIIKNFTHIKSSKIFLDPNLILAESAMSKHKN